MPAQTPVRGRARLAPVSSSAASLSSRFAQDVTAEVVLDGDVQVVAVRVRAPLPVLGVLGPDGGFDLVGRAFLERQ